MSYIKIQKILKEEVETPEEGYIYFGYDDSTVGSGVTSGVTGGFWMKDDTGSGATYLFAGYSNAPNIISFNPTSSAFNGDTITIYGINFFGAVVASFSGITGITTVVNSNQLTVIIPNLPNYDNEVDVVITSSLGTGTSVKYKVYQQINKPVITSYPSIANINSTITINGLYFIAGQTSVYFNPASTISTTTVINSTTLTAVVPIIPTGSTQFYIQTTFGQSLLSNININGGTIPIVTNFYPTYANLGDTINIFGENFIDINNLLVRFGPNQSSNISIINSGQLTVTISGDTPIGDTLISVNDMTFSGFTVCGSTSTLIPTVSSISTSVYPGNTVIMTGTNLDSPLTVTFSSVICNTLPIDSGSCYIYIGTNVIPGINTVIVINKYGSSLPYSYTVLNPGSLTITSFSINHMQRGNNSIGLYGSGFINSPSMSVYIGNVLSRFSYNNQSGLTVQILNASSTSDLIPTGPVDIRVESINSSYTLNGFTVDPNTGLNPPIISKISPIYGQYDDIIDIYGTYLSGGTISFGTSYPGTYAETTTIDDTHLSVYVPSGFTIDSNEIINIYATTIAGSCTYSPFEIYVEASSSPIINKLDSPVNVSGGTLITILGSNFVKYYTDVYVSIITGSTVQYLVLDSQKFISSTEIQGIIPNTTYIGLSMIKVVTSAGVDQETNLNFI